jgi:GNAT superfamily N-acetyltransferase
MLADDVIRLEPIGQEHLDGLAALGQDPLVLRNTRVPEPWPEGFERTWVEAYERGRQDGTRDGYAIVDAESGAFLGIAGVVDLEQGANQGEIGYALVSEARGRGIATRALELVTSCGSAPRTSPRCAWRSAAAIGARACCARCTSSPAAARTSSSTRGCRETVSYPRASS